MTARQRTLAHTGKSWLGSAGTTEIRVLFAFDPWRSAILLVGGDKSENWTRWYYKAIPEAERLYEEYLAERAMEEEA